MRFVSAKIHDRMVEPQNFAALRDGFHNGAVSSHHFAVRFGIISQPYIYPPIPRSGTGSNDNHPMQEEKEKTAHPLDGLLAVGGKPGLFRLVGNSKSGALVESLADGKRQMVGASAKVSALRDIAMYTDAGEKPLIEVFEALRTLGGTLPSPKAENAELLQFFGTAVPNFDREKVYASDVRKVLRWFAEWEIHAPAELAKEGTAEVAAEATEAKPKPKSKPKAKAAKPSEAEETDKAPAATPSTLETDEA